MKHTQVCRERDHDRHKNEIPAIWSQGWIVKFPSNAGLLLVGVQSGLALWCKPQCWLDLPCTTWQFSSAGLSLRDWALPAAASSTISLKSYLFICPFAADLQSPGGAQNPPAYHPAVWLVVHSVLKWKWLWSGKVRNSDFSSLTIWL